MTAHGFGVSRVRGECRRRARFAFEAGVDGPAGVDGALEDGAGSGIHLQTVVSSVVASAL